MKYALYEGNDHTSQEVLSADLADKYAAENWAKDWVKAHAAGDTYTLASADGALVMSVFRTQAGHWYLTPKQTAQAA